MIIEVPFGALFGNLDLNFRSFLGDDALLQHIMRLSELQRGRTGTPPASEEAINNLEEVKITSDLCKHVGEQGAEKEYPRCSICCEDLTEKATKLPCGHLFNRECISQWLKEHNQCPVCRHELPTSDPDYERRRLAASSSQASPRHGSQ
jgi:E3 ubiquitin-protein ligase RNF115/126